MDFTIGKTRHLTTFHRLTGNGLATPLAIAATGLVDLTNRHFSNGTMIGEGVSYFVSTCKCKVTVVNYKCKNEIAVVSWYQE
jgi:hypothetical protein